MRIIVIPSNSVILTSTAILKQDYVNYITLMQTIPYLVKVEALVDEVTKMKIE